MADVAQLQRQFLDFCASIFQEGFLDDKFVQVHKVDESDPNFMAEVISIFFQESERLLNELSEALEQQNVDFEWVHILIDQSKAHSANVGCQRVKNACDAFIDFCKKMNVEGCQNSLQLVKDEYFLVKTKLETLHKLAQDILAAGGSIPFPKQ